MIALPGDSAGGHLALMVGMTPASARLGPQSRVRAVLNFFGIADVADHLSGPERRSYTMRWVADRPGRLELARRVSPLTYVRKKLPPILSIHGTKDPSVHYEHATRLIEVLNRAGAHAALVTVPGGGHGFPGKQTDELYEKYVWPFLPGVGVICGAGRTGANSGTPGD